MPTFCRHNRLIQNCAICAREQSIEARPVLTSSAPASSQSRPTAPRAPRAPRPSAAPSGRQSTSRVRVRRLARGGDDGYRCELVPGLKSSIDAGRLAAELAFAAVRLELLASDPPGQYGRVAAAGEPVEERLWLAFLLAYVGPAEQEDPFGPLAAVRTSWESGELPDLDEVTLGARAAHEAGRGERTLAAYRGWAARSGSQLRALSGEDAWTPERRFARAYERLALPGLTRDARFELLISLGQLGVVEVRPATLAFGGDNTVTIAAKRALGIGDPLLLERRATALGDACGLPLAALDLGLFNWERGERATVGVPDASARVSDILPGVRSGLDLPPGSPEAG
jgi:hypothetical protein